MFTVGEFSKIAQVSARLLRYYDKIGLFTPEKVDSWTGYRYYSAYQLPQLNRILALKELGLSLDQIKRLIENDVSSDEIRGMFTMQKMQLERQLQEGVARLRLIEARLRHIDSDGDMQDFDVVVKPLPAQRYLSIRKVFPSPFHALPTIAELLLPEHLSKKAFGHMMVVLFGDSFAVENVEMEIGFLYSGKKDSSIMLSNGYQMQVRELEAIETAVTAVRVGVYENSYLSYGALGTWVEDNGYRFSGPAREVFLVPPMPGRREKAVVEVQFPVEQVNVTNLLGSQ